MTYKTGKYGLSDREREITARFVHRIVLPSGVERWIVAQHVGGGMYVAPIRRNARRKVLFDAPTSVYGTLQYIYGTAPDFNRKFDAQKGAMTYYDIETMLKMESEGAANGVIAVDKMPRESTEPEKIIEEHKDYLESIANAEPTTT